MNRSLSGMDPQVVLDRVVRLVRLDTTVFEEARDDSGFTVPAVFIAAISFFVAALGGWFWWLVQGYGDKGKAFWQSVLLGTLFAVILWVVWIAIAYVLLVNVFRYSANFERLVRSCGLATIPVAIGLFMFIPGVNLGIGIAAFAFLFLLMDIGIQVSVDAQPGHVILATFAGFLVFAAALGLLAGSDHYLTPNVFLFRTPATFTADAFSRAGSVPSIPTTRSAHDTCVAIARAQNVSTNNCPP